MNYTPTPWETTILSDGTHPGVCVAGGGDMIASIETTFADAAFIVKAVNNHDALVRALKEANSLAEEAVAWREASEDPDDHEMLPHFKAQVDRANALLDQLKES